jgi:hydroxyacylglutathione hydrolase
MESKMIFETVHAKGLAHFSYVIGDDEEGVCAVIDPRRDIERYLAIAAANQARITHILETHIHADFVSGSVELAQRTGAQIYVGAEGDYGFDHCPLQDGDTIELGPLTLRVLHTPGHTPEHICFLVSGGGAEAPWALFSGDTLFAGEVGRPDLLGKSHEEPLARQLFHSLREKILTLGDGLLVYPGHGEGSPCGAQIGSRRVTSIGYERHNNPLLGVEDEDEFVDKVLAPLTPAPAYYPRMKRINAQGAAPLGPLPHIAPLSAEQFEAEMQDPHTLVLDTREIEAFAAAHIPGALNIGNRDSFPVWAGRIIEQIFQSGAPEEHTLHPDSRILLVLGDESELETIQRHLLRVGYDNVGGYLHKGLRGWTESGKPYTSSGLLSIHDLRERIEKGDGLQLLDVRSPEEWQEDYIPTASHFYVGDLPKESPHLDRERPVAVYCGSGYRASIAVSLLQRQGFKDVRNIPGSITAWKDAGYPLEEP